MVAFLLSCFVWTDTDLSDFRKGKGGRADGWVMDWCGVTAFKELE